MQDLFFYATINHIKRKKGDNMTDIEIARATKLQNINNISKKCGLQEDEIEDKYVFYSSYGETYEWVVDLKEMQAQRILNSYCAQLSRVGLNESEWLRLIAKQ